MKVEEFETKDGKKGTKNIPEAGDVFVSKHDKVRTSEKGLYPNHSLEVTDANGNDLYLKISDGQKKGLDKIEDLKGKEIEFYSYENEYGAQVGCGLKRDE